MPISDDYLSYEDLLPLTCRPLARAPAPGELDHMAQGNIRLIEAVTAFEEQYQLPDDEGPLGQSLNRLHRKIDLLLGMTSVLLRDRMSLPSARLLRLSAREVSWFPGDDTPLLAEGAWVHLEIHLHNALEPLLLPSIIDANRPDGRVRALFQIPGEGFQSVMERHVFLRHRRLIASSGPSVIFRS